MLKENEPILFNDPNKYAPRPYCEIINNIALVHGYQDFILSPHSINLSTASTPMLQAKHQLIKDYLRPRYYKTKLPDLNRQEVLDLGGNGGFFCYWSVLHGATKATSIDLDTKYIDIVNEVSEKLGFNTVSSVECQVRDWDKPSDIVLALAMVHWLYSCTEIYGSLDQVISKLASLTKNVLIVEWVEPADSAIQFLHHIEYNADFIQGPYTLEAFEAALGNHFAHFEVLGQVSPTRTLYAATVKPTLLDLGGPMELLYEPDTLVSSHFLTNVNGAEYWSRVYKVPGQDRILKQGSFDLAEREYWFLSALSNEFFPKAYSFTRHNGYSTVELEFVNGTPLLESISKLQMSFESITAFFRNCLAILAELQTRHISHRDISAYNFIIRDSKPVLLDFGWAETPAHLVDTYGLMGGEYQPADTVFSDAYALGKVFKKVNQGRYPQLNKLIAVMCEGNRSLRITNIKTLQVLLNLIVKETGTMDSMENPALPAEEKELAELVDYVYKYNQQLASLKVQLVEKQTQLDKQAQTIENLTRQFSALQAQQNQSAVDEQTLATWKEQAAKNAEEAYHSNERAFKNYQALQALQGTRTVKFTRLLTKSLGFLKRK